MFAQQFPLMEPVDYSAFVPQPQMVVTPTQESPTGQFTMPPNQAVPPFSVDTPNSQGVTPPSGSDSSPGTGFSSTPSSNPHSPVSPNGFYCCSSQNLPFRYRDEHADSS